VQVERNLLAGRQWVVDLDIEKCYDSIPHELLVDRVARRVSDGRVLSLIRSFLKSGVMEEMNVRYEATGTPQGGIISPTLANIFLHDLDVAMEARGIAWVRYADDIVALCRSREEAEQAWELIGQTLQGLGLKLSPEKTRIVHLDEGFDFLGWHYQRAETLASQEEHRQAPDDGACIDTARSLRQSAVDLRRTGAHSAGLVQLLSLGQRAPAVSCTGTAGCADVCAVCCANARNGAASVRAVAITSNGPTRILPNMAFSRCRIILMHTVVQRANSAFSLPETGRWESRM
jgi:group II intron reverse transcriptase/maturase